MYDMRTWIFAIFISLGVFISSINTLHATHVMGMDIYYECTGPNTYTFTLDLYRDCSGVTPSGFQTLNFNSPSGCGADFSVALNLVNIGGTEVSQVCPPDLPFTNCNPGGTIPGTELWTYTATVTFPAACDDWFYSWSKCCRNGQITNLVSPDTYLSYMDGIINTTICNNSPRFTSLPTPYICVGQLFCYSLGIIDSDNDSLVFSLVQPLNGPAPGTPIAYVGGHTVNEPLTSSTPWTFDPTTGAFCFTPDVIQYGVVKIQIEEYSNGVLIGRHSRELQIIVQNCTNLLPVFGVPPVTNLIGGILTAPTVLEVCPGDNVIFDVTATDPNGDNITMTSNVSGAIPAATFTTSCVCPNVTGTFNWIPTGSDIGTHFLTINIQDDGCQILGLQYMNVTIIVLSGTYAGPDRYYCPAGGPVQLSATGGSTFTWTPSTGLSCTACPNPFASPIVTTDYIVTSNLSSTCKNTDTVTVFVVPGFSPDAGPDDTICLNQVTQLNATALPPDTYTYLWTPTTGLSDPTISNPIATPTNTTTYTVSVTSSAGCTMTDSMTVTISGIAPIIIATTSDTMVCPGDTVQLNALIINPFCSDYTVTSIPYVPIVAGGWTTITLNNDQMSWALPIGFSFTFYCNPYTQFWISSNGWITFTSTFNSDPSNDLIPTAAVVNNIIALAWDDLYPPGGGTIRYKTIGTVPNRQLIVEYNNINQCCSGTTPTVTVHAILYETTNTIEIHYTDVEDVQSTNVHNNGGIVVLSDGSLTSGIENFDGTAGVPAPGKNATVWTATNEAVRFELPPLIGSFTYNWTPAIGLNNPNIANPLATVNQTTTYIVTVTDNANPSCTGNALLTVQIDTSVTVTASPDTTICLGPIVNVQLNANVTGTPPPSSLICGVNGSLCTNPNHTETVGTGPPSLGGNTPYKGFWQNGRMQILYTAADLNASGIISGTISEIAFDVSVKGSTQPYDNFTIKMKCTPLSCLEDDWETGLTTVFLAGICNYRGRMEYSHP